MNTNKIEWFEHFLHKGMFIKKENGNTCSGWDCKGNKFFNQFYFVDNRYKKIEDPEQIELLELELAN